MTVWPLARIERWFLRAGLFLLPLAFWAGTYDHYVLPKVFVARALVFGLLVFYVLRAISAGTLSFKRSPLDLPLSLFICSAAASTVFAENTNIAVFGIYSRYDGFLTILTYAALFWLSNQAIDGPSDARSLLRILIASGYVVAAIAIVQSLMGLQPGGALPVAFGTLGQQNVLGAFLAMLLPLAYWELTQANGRSEQILALNALAVLGLALLLTFSRSAWLGTAIGAVVVLFGIRHSAAGRIGLATLAVLVTAALALAALNGSGWLRIENAIANRAMTVFDPGAWGPRPAIWRDSLQLIASRPLFGYGPDTFGLVFPRFQSIPLGSVQVDKAHSEVLQVAATQGLVGLVAYVWLLAAFVRTFVRGRGADGAYPIFAGWVGYQVTLLLNFSALAAAFPFWVFAAAAMTCWGASRPAKLLSVNTKVLTPVGRGVMATAATVAIASTVLPYLADSHLLSSVNADYRRQLDEAEQEAAKARLLGPTESVYAVEVGNLAFERRNWAAARIAYLEAARLGTYNPGVYRNLALADRALGLWADGKAAARKAVELDRFDPANQALLSQFEVGGP